MRLIFLIIALFCCCVLPAQSKKLQYDTSTVTVRLADVSAYKQQKDFQYKEPVIVPEGWWDRFWSWVWTKYAEMMSTPAGRTTFNTILIVLGIAAIVFFILKVTGMNATALFKRDAANMNYSVNAENISQINFNAAIENAIQQQNYIAAVRLLYLQTLKLLSDKSLINWKPDKTNTDYVNELHKFSQQNNFIRLTHVFDYAWYGNKTMNRTEFQDARQLFQQFQQAVNSEKL